jgi:hypothetical protein
MRTSHHVLDQNAKGGMGGRLQRPAFQRGSEAAKFFEVSIELDALCPMEPDLIK